MTVWIEDLHTTISAREILAATSYHYVGMLFIISAAHWIHRTDRGGRDGVETVSAC